MSRKLKSLTLALLAVGACAAISAQAASAAVEHSFTSQSSATKVTGTNIGENVFALTASPIEWGCESTTFTGTFTGEESDQIAIHPEFSKCQWDGWTEVTTLTEGCNYVLDSDTSESADFEGVEHARVSVQCEAGKYIGVLLPGCSLKIEPSAANQNLVGTTYTAEGSGSSADLKINWTLRTMHYTAAGAWCPLIGIKTGTFLAGDFTGTTTLQGYKDEGGSEGAQVGIGLSTP